MLPFQLPLGFGFYPTDKELMVDYLLKKVRGEPLPSGVVVDRDIYKVEPWKIQKPENPFLDKREAYYFTRAKKKGTSDNRLERNAGRGFWHANGRHQDIKDGEKLVGHSMAFKYHDKQENKEVKTDCLMHEFRLDPGLYVNPDEDEETVLCRIRDNSKRAEKGRSPDQCRAEELLGDVSDRWMWLAEQPIYYDNSTDEVGSLIQHSFDHKPNGVIYGYASNGIDCRTDN